MESIVAAKGSDLRPHSRKEDREFSDPDVLQLKWAESFCLDIPEEKRDAAILKELDNRAKWFRTQVLQNEVRRREALTFFRENPETAFNYLEELYPGSGTLH